MQICVIFVSSKNGYMNVEFEKEYLAELYEKGKTDDKKHRFQPQKGLSSLRINDQYRLEFKEITNAGNQTIIEVCSLKDITNHYK